MVGRWYHGARIVAEEGFWEQRGAVGNLLLFFTCREAVWSLNSESCCCSCCWGGAVCLSTA